MPARREGKECSSLVPPRRQKQLEICSRAGNRKSKGHFALSWLESVQPACKGRAFRVTEDPKGLPGPRAADEPATLSP